MNIEYKDYIIKQSTSDRFDLVQKVTRTKKDSEETYITNVDVGYDMRLESCINRIVLEQLKKKQETVSLQKFLTEYYKEKDELLNAIKLD